MRTELRWALLGLLLSSVLLLLLTYRGAAASQAEPVHAGATATADSALPVATRGVAMPAVARQASKPLAAIASSSVPLPRRVHEAASPAVSAQSAVIVDEASGGVLWEKDGHRRLAMASLTKIVTAIVALERGRLDQRVPIDVDFRDLDDSTVMGLLPGEELTLEDLLYGLMLPSGNDAALAIARHVGGSEDAFAGLMNAKAAELGLEDSHFVNPHGLDAPGHFSSAYDLAMFARDGMLRYDAFRKLAATKVWTARGKRGPYELWNLNRLLYGQYDGADGVKIGYTEEAGRTMVASATRNGHRVYASFLDSRNLVADASELLDYAFENFRWEN